MSILTSTLCILLCAYVAQSKSYTSVYGVGHYWREYEGYIPTDALPAAPNSYIGQVFAFGIRKPANINGLEKHAEFIHKEKVYTTIDHVKILCSTDPSQFEWVSTDAKDIMRLLPNRYIIQGGKSERNDPLLIGRSQEHHVVGMVTLYTSTDGLYYPLKGYSKYATEFDVYAYKKK